MNISGYAFVVGGGECVPINKISADASENETTGSGIGKACAILFAKEGAAGVMVADVDVHASANVAAECNAVAINVDFRVEHVQVDVTLEVSVKQAITQTMQAFGRIDYCVNCAGVSFLSSTRTCTGC